MTFRLLRLALVMGLVLLSGAVRAEPAALGAYVGNRPEDLAAFEAWLGRRVDLVAAHLDRRNWVQWENSAGWAARLWQRSNRPLRWSVPLFADGGTLKEAAAGDYRYRYERLARRIGAFRPKDETIIVRLGEAFNRGEVPWSAKGREVQFVQAFRLAVAAFRSVSPRFRFEWNLSLGGDGTATERAYPGDDVVDIVSMDFFYDPRRDGDDAAAVWTSMVERPYGLKWHEAFAKAHGKPTAYGAWRVEGGQAAAIVEAARTWFDEHPVAYQIYWEAQRDLSGNASPVAEAYRKAFGKPR